VRPGLGGSTLLTFSPIQSHWPPKQLEAIKSLPCGIFMSTELQLDFFFPLFCLCFFLCFMWAPQRLERFLNYIYWNSDLWHVWNVLISTLPMSVSSERKLKQNASKYLQLFELRNQILLWMQWVLFERWLQLYLHTAGDQFGVTCSELPVWKRPFRDASCFGTLGIHSTASSADLALFLLGNNKWYYRNPYFREGLTAARAC